uniref:DUF484 family protein n=1 Tax=Ningiella ruwaisensis TaxID=2364274 RepID=UPI00109FC29F|nr:DUF484 family protein [Ningiella ruwaisensis]
MTHSLSPQAEDICKADAANEQTQKNHETAPIQAKDIVAYLQQNPDFFLQHPQVLSELQVHHQNKGVVSLTQLQIEQYRDKIKSQKKQLEQLIHNAKRNETIYTTYADVNLAIAKSSSIQELNSILSTQLCKALGLSQAVLYPFNDAIDSPYKLPELQQRALLDKRLNKQPFYFGRLNQHEKQVLFSMNEDAQKSVESVALIVIGTDKDNVQEKPIALLAIASENPLHFSPDMDTTLLAYLQAFLTHQLKQFA